MKKYFLLLHMVALLLSQRIMSAQQLNSCLLLEIYDFRNGTLSIFENEYTNLTFWTNTSSCQQPNMVYRIEVHTKTEKGSSEYDGRLVIQANDTCIVVIQKSVNCISSTGPAQFYRKLNRSHTEIVWTLSWKNSEHEEFTVIRKKVKLKVLYPPKVTRLTVDGGDVAGNYLTEDGQEVNVECSFDRGNPPVIFRLRDRSGHEVKLAKNGGFIYHSFTASCKEDWPFFACEGTGSEQNKTVSFLVKCAPQFVDVSPKIFDHAAYESWIFSVRAHTTAFDECLLVAVSAGESFQKEVNCDLSGNPPDLLLVLHLNKEDNSRNGNWKVSLSNEKGISSIAFALGTASGAVLEFRHLKNDNLRLSKCDYINVTFWLKVSGSKHTNTIYRMTAKIKGDTGVLEEAGRLTVTNGTCNVTAVESLHCISTAGLLFFTGK